MKQFLLTMAGVFAGLLLFFIGVPILLLGMIAGAAKPAPTPTQAVLSLDLRNGLTDQEPGGAFSIFGGSKLAVMSVVSALHRAETDDRVKAVFVRLPEGGVEPGEADELRLAFKHFEAAGKPIITHSQGLYPSGAITSTYQLGAASSELWMQPGAPFQATGMTSEDMFLKRFFDKYGIKAQFEQRYEYKNAVNTYLNDDYTAAHRESELSWMGSIYQSALTSAAADRKQDPAKLRATIEAGPYDAGDALAKGLVDKIGEVRDAQKAALAKGGDNAKLVDMDDYIRDGADQSGSGATVAVINAEGDISTGPSGGGGFGSGNGINSDDISNALYTAADDSSIKAIVFRVSSPGGSDTASEQILAAVKAAKAKKPVVVSMGTYGASGGYWISSAASAIIAEPTTLTGSIGVFGGKFALGPALSKFGVDMRDLSVGGAYANADGSANEFTPAQHAAFAASIDKVYNGFVARVAEGRHLPVARVQEIARGRVWTGAQAKGLGLIDDVGGFYQAVDKAKSLAGITGDVRLKTIAAKKSPFAAIAQALGASSSSARSFGQVSSLLNDPQAQSILREMTEARLRSHGGTVLAPLPRF